MLGEQFLDSVAEGFVESDPLCFLSLIVGDLGGRLGGQMDAQVGLDAVQEFHPDAWVVGEGLELIEEEEEDVSILEDQPDQLCVLGLIVLILVLLDQRLHEPSEALNVPLHLALLLLCRQAPTHAPDQLHLLLLEELLLILRLQHLDHYIRHRLVPEVVDELRQLRPDYLDHLHKAGATSSERW